MLCAGTQHGQEGAGVERGAITIRRATRRDIPSLLRLYGAIPTPDDDEPATLSPGEADAIFDRIDADANQALLVAESDLRVIGTLVLVVVQNLAHWGQPWAVVENVAVHESVRGQGIGTLLLEEAVRRARGARCYKLVLSAHQSRTESHRLYRKLGLQQTHLGFELLLI
jgi:GNAT superfamily N-acetyltransferase